MTVLGVIAVVAITFVVIVVIGAIIGVLAIGGMWDSLTNIDGPHKLGWYGEWQLKRANKKYEKSKRANHEC
jgi:hypothetical protein